MSTSSDPTSTTTTNASSSSSGAPVDVVASSIAALGLPMPAASSSLTTVFGSQPQKLSFGKRSAPSGLSSTTGVSSSSASASTSASTTAAAASATQAKQTTSSLTATAPPHGQTSVAPAASSSHHSTARPHQAWARNVLLPTNPVAGSVDGKPPPGMPEEMMKVYTHATLSHEWITNLDGLSCLVDELLYWISSSSLTLLLSSTPYSFIFLYP